MKKEINGDGMKFITAFFSLTLLFMACSEENDNKPGESADSLTQQEAVTQSADTSAVTPDSGVSGTAGDTTALPGGKILPKSKVIAASKDILAWIKSKKFDEELKKQVKVPQDLNKFLAKRLDELASAHGFDNRGHYVATERNYLDDPEVKKLADQVQAEFDRKLEPVVSKNELSPEDKAQRDKLVNSLKRSIELIKGDKYRNMINEALEKGISDQAYYDNINEQLLIEAGFESLDEALSLIKKFSYDPDVHTYALELRKITTEMLNEDKSTNN